MTILKRHRTKRTLTIFCKKVIEEGFTKKEFKEIQLNSKAVPTVTVYGKTTYHK